MGHPIHDSQTILAMKGLCSMLRSGRSTIDELRRLAKQDEDARLEKEAREAAEERLLEHGSLQPCDL